MLEQYKGYYLVYNAAVNELTTEQLETEIEEYERRCESARRNGEGISTKEAVRRNMCRDELLQRNFGHTNLYKLREFFGKQGGVHDQESVS